MRAQSVSSACHACSAAIAAWIAYGPVGRAGRAGQPRCPPRSRRRARASGPGRSSSTSSPLRVHARVAARVVQQHQREQAAHLGLVGHQLGQQRGQPDRLVAQLAAHDRVGRRGEVALVEDQVERRAAPSAAGRAARGRAAPRRGCPASRILRLARTRRCCIARLAGQERARHLGRREPAERAQRQRHARLGGERRVAAGEEQPQPVVGQRRVERLVGLRRHQQLQLAQLVRVAALAAQAVDRAVARRRARSRRRVVRQPVARPALQRDHERLLHRVLGEVEVAEDADQGRHRPAGLAPERGGGDPRRSEPLGCRGRRRLPARSARRPAAS